MSKTDLVRRVEALESRAAGGAPLTVEELVERLEGLQRAGWLDLERLEVGEQCPPGERYHMASIGCLLQTAQERQRKGSMPT